MDKQSFEYLRDDTEKALTAGRLTEALHCLQGLVSATDTPEWGYELEAVQQDYRMMLDFMQQGGNDPQRESVYRQLVNRSYTLLDKTARRFRIENIKDAYTAAYRHAYGMETTGPDDTATRIRLLVDKIEEEKLYGQKYTPTQDELYPYLDLLFDQWWTAPTLNSDEEASWQKTLLELPERIQAMLTGALLLSLIEYFDARKYKILLHLCLHAGNTPVRIRALTAVIWTYMKYAARFATAHSDLCEGIRMLAQDARMRDELLILQRGLIISLETSKVEKKMQNEILPELLKNKGLQRHKLGFTDLDEELAQALRGEPNAEWDRQTPKQKKLAESMMKIVEMGQEGVDINIGTFSSLKRFPFFQTVAHWFLPFDEGHPEVRKVLPENPRKSVVRLILSTGNFCDSDKYSLCLMLNNIMPGQSEAMLSQLSTQMEMTEEMMTERASMPVTTEQHLRSYLQDLYRFFRLYSGHAQFADPFRMDQLFTSYEATARMTHDIPSYAQEISAFLVKHEFYQDAIGLLEDLLKTGSATAEILQKVGFCHQHTGNPNKALFYYQQADLLNPDNEWILRQMYLCHAALGRYEQELNCLTALESITPDNPRLLSEKGRCLMQLERYEEAARCFYELEYKEERVTASRRAIAWCCFKQDKMEQAYKYYTKILNGDSRKWEDHLNAGHTAWCLDKTTEAISHYREYLRLYAATDKNVPSPLQPFDEDAKELYSHGKSRLDVCLMRDMIAATPEGERN